MSYYAVSTPPSRKIPYPVDSVIQIRDLLLEEVYYIEEISKKEIEIMDMLFKNEVIKTSFPFYDLTYNDYLYLILLSVAMTYPELRYEKVTECPNCKGETKELYVNVPYVDDQGNPFPFKRKEVIKGEVNSVVLPSNMQVKQLDESLDSVKGDPIPLYLTVSNGNQIGFDYLRIKYLKEILSSIKEGDEINTLKLMSMRAKTDIGKLSPMDAELFGEAESLLDHGLLTLVDGTCPLCQETFQVNFNWRVSSLIPFRGKGESIKTRISIGKRLQSAVPINAEAPVSPDNGVQRNDSGNQGIPKVTKGDTGDAKHPINQQQHNLRGGKSQVKKYPVEENIQKGTRLESINMYDVP